MPQKGDRGLEGLPNIFHGIATSHENNFGLKFFVALGRRINL